MTTEQLPFLGTGWSFPPTFEKETRSVSMVSGLEDVRQSLSILLATHVGERVMHPTFGCNLEEFVFDSITVDFQAYIRDLVSKAIIYYEPRVELKAIGVNSVLNEGILTIEVSFVLRTTNTRFNMVYDFYKKEATLTNL